MHGTQEGNTIKVQRSEFKKEVSKFYHCTKEMSPTHVLYHRKGTQNTQITCSNEAPLYYSEKSFDQPQGQSKYFG